MTHIEYLFRPNLAGLSLPIIADKGVHLNQAAFPLMPETYCHSVWLRHLENRIAANLILLSGYNRNPDTFHKASHKQASTYMHYKQKRPVKGAPSEFKDFVSNFRQDTTWSAVETTNQDDH